MNKIRIGKDLKIQLTVLTNGANVPLEGRDIELHLRNPFGDTDVIAHTVSGNVLSARLSGAEQKYCGVYTLTVWENRNSIDSTVLDFEQAFELVSSTALETPKAESLEVEEVVALSGDMAIGVQGASAYEIAVANGFKGTEAEWLESLKLHYDDLTAEEKAELQKPITDIAVSVTEAERQRQQAEEIRRSSEVSRTGEEEKRATAEGGRKTAEDARVTAETKRVSAETSRAEAEVSRSAEEKKRASAEVLRAEAEVLRATAESKRGEAEAQRMTDEDLRKVAEQNRVKTERARVTAEAERMEAEAARTSEEGKRVVSEDERSKAEQVRVTAEEGRKSAEQARVTAEANRQQQTTAAIEAAKTATASATSATAEAAKAVTAATNATAEAKEAAKLATDAAGKTSTIDYAVCTTAATTATKEINIAGFALGTHCRFLVKMSHIAETEDVKLSVRSGDTLTGAKPLTFNGAPASVNNTWRAGDILDIYYDGLSFHATHYMGGYGITEINVSEMCPKGGHNGTNKFTLAEAIKKIPEVHQRVGFKCSFINDNNKLQTFVYQGGTWGNVASWVEGGGGSLRAMYLAAGAKFNANTGYYELNGIKDLTEDEMLEIYRYTYNFGFYDVRWFSFAGTNIRTNFIAKNHWSAVRMTNIGVEGLFSDSPKLEVFVGSNNQIHAFEPNDVRGMFSNCKKLRDIGYINMQYIKYASHCSRMFFNCFCLENAYLAMLKVDISFSSSPLLTYKSYEYIITNAKNSNPISVQVHSTTYDYLTGVTQPTEQVGGTSEEWQALITTAASKQITFTK